MVNNKKNKIAYIIFYIFVIIVFAIFFFLRVGSDADYSFDDDIIYDWSEDWEISSGVSIDVISSLPALVDVDKGATVILKKTLPKKIKKYNCIMIESKRQDISVYVDGILREAYSDKETRKVGNSSPSAVVIAPLYSTDALGDVKILVSSNTSYTGDIGRIYLGNDMSIILTVLKGNMLWLSLNVLLFITGIICLFIFFIYRNSFETVHAMIYLFWFGVLASVFCFTQMALRQVFIKDIALFEALGHSCLLLLPLPIILFANEVFKNKYRIVLGVCYTVAIANFILQLLLQIITGRVYNLYDMQSISKVIIVLTLIVSISLYAKERIGGLRNRNVYLLVSLVGFALFVSADIFFTSINMDLTCRLFLLGTEIFIAANLIDTTIEARKEYEKKKNAENANMAKSQFLATMSHEIRTPINSVLGMNEMIIRDTKDPVIMEYAQNINSAGNVLLGLINDILDFSKIEFGKLELVITHYETKTLFTDLYNLIEERARKKGLNLEVKMDPQMPTVLEGDMGRIRQIITNFLTNAVKYTETGSVVLSAVMKDPDTNPTLHVDIIDSGQGIRDEDKDRLFSSFTRLNEEKNQSIEGTGLGLAITKQLVAMMNGSISVESTFGVGSTFSVDIPQVVVDNTQVGDFNPARGNRGKSGNRFKITFQYPEGKVLIVDDNKTNLIVATGLLKPTKMKVTTAASGDEAIALVKENEYDLIFMDHMMPVKDGIETLHEMQSIFGSDFKTPVIVLTANAISGMRDMYIKEGFNDYLTKPISTKQLEEMLVSFIGDYRQEQTEE